MRGLHERHGMWMLLHPALALVDLHADAAMTGPYQLAAEVFMVHAHQALRGATLLQRKVLHGIAVGAELAQLLRVHGGGIEPVEASTSFRVSKSFVPVTRLSPQRATML